MMDLAEVLLEVVVVADKAIVVVERNLNLIVILDVL